MRPLRSGVYESSKTYHCPRGLAGPDIVDFGGLNGPSYRKTIPKGGELRPSPFGMVFGAAGAAQAPKFDDFRPAQKPGNKNPSVVAINHPLAKIIILGLVGLGPVFQPK